MGSTTSDRFLVAFCYHDHELLIQIGLSLLIIVLKLLSLLFVHGLSIFSLGASQFGLCPWVSSLSLPHAANRAQAWRSRQAGRPSAQALNRAASMASGNGKGPPMDFGFLLELGGVLCQQIGFPLPNRFFLEAPCFYLRAFQHIPTIQNGGQ